MNERLAALEEIVRAAGLMALSLRDKLEVSRKPDGTVVTQADVAVEKFLHENLGALAPDAGFLGEENTSTNLQGQKNLWVVDPIDGTDAYRLGLAYFGVSVALAVDCEPVLGAFYNPFMDEMYLAAAGEGATLNGEPIHVRLGISLDDVCLALGPSNFHRYYSMELPIKMHSLGSTAQHFAMVADGRACCVFCRPHIWDIAAGVLLVSEAGGMTRMLNGDDFCFRDYLENSLFKRPVLAAPPDIWEQLAGKIRWKL